MTESNGAGDRVLGGRQEPGGILVDTGLDSQRRTCLRAAEQPGPRNGRALVTPTRPLPLPLPHQTGPDRPTGREPDWR